MEKKNICQDNTNQKKASVAVSTSDKGDFRANNNQGWRRSFRKDKRANLSRDQNNHNYS